MLEPSCVQKLIVKIQEFSGQFLNYDSLKWGIGQYYFTEISKCKKSLLFLAYIKHYITTKTKIDA